MTSSTRSVSTGVELWRRTPALAMKLAAAAMAAALGSAPALAQSGPSTTLASSGTSPAPLAVAALAASAPMAAASESSAPPIADFTTRDMLSRLNQPWVQMIDVRPAQEYAGRDIRTLRGGHIP
ncbi:MAG TPA: hypothetical protein PK177_09930, partial [Burkholderiaceae bacterium]|nr:hypothetical protein [Burkholderiaceae bacterium]